MQKKYYQAYENRYQTVHEKGLRWSSNTPTPIVLNILQKYNFNKEQSLLEIGCGEGRDSKAVFEAGYHLIATDVSNAAIAYCKNTLPSFCNHFRVLDCLSDKLQEKFDFIFAIAVVHMLVLDNDRAVFYQFIHQHLKENGIALICSMGDGNTEMQSDISNAFTLQERNHESGKIMVAGTSCRMVSFATFENELHKNNFKILEQGVTSALPDFNNLMYAVIKK